VVDLALDGGLGEYFGRLLEGRGGHPAVGCERRLCDAEQDRRAGGESESLFPGVDARLDRLVGILELVDVDGGAGEQIGAAGILDADLAHHLADNDFDVLVVDIDALLTVHLLDFLHQIVAHARAAELVVVHAADAEHIVRAERTAGQLLSLFDMVAVLHDDAGANGDLIHTGLALLGVGDGERHHVLAGFLDRKRAADLAEHGHLLGLARLEKLFDSRQTLRDVVTGDAAAVERTHGQLRAGLADGLRGDDADGFAGIDRLAGSKVHAVAAGAYAAA